MPPLWIALKNGPTITADQALTLSALWLVFPEMRWGVNECRCCIRAHTSVGTFVIGVDGEWNFYLGEGVVLGD